MSAATGPDQFSETQKDRRVRSPRNDDEWPGTWRVFDSQMTSLPSWRNDDGKVIRADLTTRPPRAFVHSGGMEEWQGIAQELHDEMWAYMEDHPGDGGLTARDLTTRGHSLRNFEPEEFRKVARTEGKREARQALEFVESGRFEPVLAATQRMFRALDGDERREFAQENPGLMRWVNVWGFLEDVGEFDVEIPDPDQAKLTDANGQ